MYEQHIILDFEMNPVPRRRRDIRRNLRSEIIEIGAVRLDSSFRIVDRFSILVRPDFSEEIAPEITQLTGITTADVSSALSLKEALSVFESWVGSGRCRVYSWSACDWYQLDDECWLKELDFPENLSRWVDFQAVYPRMLGLPAKGQQLALHAAAAQFGISFDRSAAHRALYDAEKTTELLLPFLDGSYRSTARHIQEVFKPAVVPSSCSLDAASGGKLSQFFRQLSATPTELPLAACV